TYALYFLTVLSTASSTLRHLAAPPTTDTSSPLCKLSYVGRVPPARDESAYPRQMTGAARIESDHELIGPRRRAGDRRHDPERTWVLIVESPDGGWGIAGNCRSSTRPVARPPPKSWRSGTPGSPGSSRAPSGPLPASRR